MHFISGKLDSIMLRLRVELSEMSEEVKSSNTFQELLEMKEGLETDIREMKSSSSERWEDLKIKVRDGWSKLSTRLEETIETLETITESFSGSSR